MKKWRTRLINDIAKDMVKNRIKVHFERDGKMVYAAPTLIEARRVADDMQTLLDMANGDAPMDTLDRLHGKPH